MDVKYPIGKLQVPENISLNDGWKTPLLIQSAYVPRLIL